MGDPKFSRRKYVTPSHPWQKERIEAENEFIRKFGLKNKTELWKVQSLLRTFRKRARELQAQVRYGDEQAEKEMDALLKRLDKIGVLSSEATLDDVLVLEADSLLGRRLQTMTYLKGLSNSQKQARQFIVHGHISIGDRRVTVPGYLVKRDEEDLINYLSKSPLADELHPARPKDEETEGMEPGGDKLGAEPAEEGKPGGDEPSKEETPKEGETASGPKEPTAEKSAEPEKTQEPKGEDKPEEPAKEPVVEGTKDKEADGATKDEAEQQKEDS
jgi:small subunit ribosomal protein S4